MLTVAALALGAVEVAGPGAAATTPQDCAPPGASPSPSPTASPSPSPPPGPTEAPPPTLLDTGSQGALYEPPRRELGAAVTFGDDVVNRAAVEAKTSVWPGGEVFFSWPDNRHLNVVVRTGALGVPHTLTVARCVELAGNRWTVQDASLGLYAQPFPPPPDRLYFPVQAPTSYSDTFGACRDGCRRHHQGQDLFCNAKGAPIVAAHEGVVTFTGSYAIGGLSIGLRHPSGWYTNYIHLNNDTPGTDNGRGVPWPPWVHEGLWVPAGAHIGYCGDSGNAEGTPPHLHFELRRPRTAPGVGGDPVNPYGMLRNAVAHPPGRASGGTAGRVVCRRRKGRRVCRRVKSRSRAKKRKSAKPSRRRRRR